MNAAHSQPWGAMRRVRLLIPMRSNFVVVPALACVGMALGLAFTRLDGTPSVAVANQRVTPGNAARPLLPAQAPATSRDQARLRAPSSPVATSGVPAPIARTALPTRLGPNSEPHETPAASPENPVYDESSVKLAEAQKLPAEVSGASDVDARAATLRQIDASVSPDSLRLLEQTLRTDAAPRNRLLAVSSLRQFGKQADSAERVRAALRAAMSDADENVATSARDAYQELAQ
jgi:hypothetical protein